MHVLNILNISNIVIIIIAIHLLFGNCNVALVSATNNSNANRLYEDLMMSYNRFVRPVQNDSDTLTVKLGLKLSQLIDVVSFWQKSHSSPLRL